jgi:hypothetical protein
VDIRRSAAVALLAAALGTAAGCVTPAQPALVPPSANRTMLLAADEYGAVVFDGNHGSYRGVSRTGGQVWQDRDAVRDAGTVDCLARCPDVVVSTSLRSLNSPEVPDPAPRLIVAGEVRPMPNAAGHKRYVLTATGPDDFVLGAGSPAQGWWLELHGTGHTADRLPVSGPRTSWQQSADGRHAVALTAASESTEARWFTRSDNTRRWQQVGQVSSASGTRACVATDGSRALLLGRQPAFLDRAGNRSPAADLVVGSGCAFAADGSAIIVELAQGTGGSRARIRVLDPTGATRWTHDLTDPASVTADPRGDRLAYVANGALHEFGGRTIHNVVAARYTARGSLVAVGADRTVRWIAPSQSA